MLLGVQNARKALEAPKDPGDDGEEELLARRAPLGAGVPKHWGRVRAACLEGVLGIACNTGHHADVWDAAARLLADHHECALLSQIRKSSMLSCVCVRHA